MRNFVHTFVASFLIIILTLQFPIITKANEDSSDFEMIQVDPSSQDKGSSEYGIMPLKTFYGSGGSASLDYVSGARAVHWKVHPNTAKTYGFDGQMIIKTASTGVQKGSGNVVAVGKGSKSEQKSLSSMHAKLKKNSRYKAYFYGTAVTKDGKQIYVVVNNAYITFTYK